MLTREQTNGTTSPGKALAGIRILDLSHVFQGPVATQLLADFGADVIKVERPGGGDWSRMWGPFVDGVSMPFACLNRNKRSIAVDLKAPDGNAVIHSSSPPRTCWCTTSAAASWRSWAWATMSCAAAASPASSTPRPAAGAIEGPYVEQGRGGHDMMARAEGGWFVHAGTEQQPIPGGISADYPAGLMLANAILMALFARERTGRGQRVTTDLFSVALHGHVWTGAHLLNLDREQTGGGAVDMEDAIDTFLPDRGRLDRGVARLLHATRCATFRSAMGIGDLSEDPRYASAEQQLARRDEINALLAEHFRTKTTDEWMEQLAVGRRALRAHSTRWTRRSTTRRRRPIT